MSSLVDKLSMYFFVTLLQRPVHMNHPADELDAKRLIVGIIQMAGGTYRGQVRLYKVFYEAHRWHWQTFGKPLSGYPIVHMPHGPGIDDGDEILASLEREARISRDTEPAGDYEETVFTAAQGDRPVALSREEEEAIKAGLAWVGGKSATQISDESHKRSRTWQKAHDAGKPGSELLIALDALTEAEYERHAQIARDIQSLTS